MLTKKILLTFLCFATIAAWIPVARGAIFINSYQLGGSAAVPVIESFTDYVGDVATPHTITAPSGITTGDLLVLVVGCDPDNTNSDFISVSTDGWIKIEEYGLSTVFDQHVAAFYKIAGIGGPDGNVNVDLSTTRRCMATYYRISGANLSDPIDNYAGGVSGPTTSYNLPSVTTEYINSLRLAMLASDLDSASVTYTIPTSGWSKTDFAASSAFFDAVRAVNTLNNSAGLLAGPQINLSISAEAAYIHLAISSLDGLLTVPNQPTGLAAVSGGFDSIDLSWDAIDTDAYAVRIERSPNGTDSWATLATEPKTTTTYTDEGLDYNTTYYYRIVAVNQIGDSTVSATASATTDENFLPQVEGWTQNSLGGGIGTSLTITAPAGIQAGEVLLAFLSTDNTGSTPTHGVSSPGWTKIRQQTNGSQSDASVFYKIADGTESSVQLTTDISRRMVGAFIRISGAHATTPINAHNGGNTSGTTHTVPGVTTTVDNCMLVALLSMDGPPATFEFTITTPNWTKYDLNSGTTFHDAAWGEGYQVTAGATGDVTFTTNASDGGSSVLVAICAPN